jgi:hypothetical protein
MPFSRPRVATAEGGTDAISESLSRLDHAVEELREAVRSYQDTKNRGRNTSRPRQALLPGGIVLLTDDGLGIARAVAADLRALGHPVVRVHHGVGDGPIEGVNLTSAAAVAALIERIRSQGRLAAIVHSAPLGAVPKLSTSWSQPDDARTLALLAQSSAADLISSAELGGSCLVVARSETQTSDGLSERLERWVEISARSLTSVRVRSLSFADGGEPEVVAAELVRAILGTDEDCSIAGHIGSNKPESHTMMLGAPDRAAWLQLAAALLDWLEDSPDVRLNDLSFTLHENQPSFPFRVGLVVASSSNLIAKLHRTICQLADPACTTIEDLSGIYCFDTKARSAHGPRSKETSSPIADRRLRFPSSQPWAIATSVPITLESIIERSGREWLNHLLAAQFARVGTIRRDLLGIDPGAQLLDLSTPLPPSSLLHEFVEDKPADIETGALHQVLDSLDALAMIRRASLMELIDQEPGS